MSFVGVISDSIQRQLDPGERVLWTGQPKQGVLLRGSDAFLIPFSLLWAGFAFFWEWSAIQTGAPLAFLLWGVPFVAMGIYMVIGRFFVESWQRSKTHYAVTNERILIVDGIRRETVRTSRLGDLADISLSIHSDGAGTITFGSSSMPEMLRSLSSWPGVRERMGLHFDLVPDAKVVFDLIRSAQRSLRK